jgi:hypothetical protein
MADNSSASKAQLGKFIVQDGIATDTETGLMWLRFAYGEQWKDNNIVGNLKLLYWYESLEVASKFNNEGGYGGYDDWRVPTIDELKTIVLKISKSSNLMNIFARKKEWLFWSSSFYEKNSLWFVNFKSSRIYASDEEYKGCVRLVRSVASNNQERQEKLEIEPKIEKRAKLAAEREHQVEKEQKATPEALQKIDDAKQARIKAEEQTEIARQEKLEAERTIESEKLKHEQLKTAHAQLELEKERLKREFELKIEKLKIESEQKIKLELERLKAELMQANEIIETETILEVVTVEVETEKPKIIVPLLKDEATQNFEDMF